MLESDVVTLLLEVSLSPVSVVLLPLACDFWTCLEILPEPWRWSLQVGQRSRSLMARVTDLDVVPQSSQVLLAMVSDYKWLPGER